MQQPTELAPGTEEKIALMRERWEAGLPLHVAGDVQHDTGSKPVEIPIVRYGRGPIGMDRLEGVGDNSNVCCDVDKGLN